jgi:hypothetical protein
MSERGDRNAALIQAMKDLHLTDQGLAFVWGYLAEYDPDRFQEAINKVTEFAEHTRSDLIIGGALREHITAEAITYDRIQTGLYIVHGGKRWRVAGRQSEGAMIRLRLTRPWANERTSALWTPDEEITLDALQSTRG